MTNAYLTAEQAAEQLQMHPRTIRRMLADGRIPGAKIGTKEWRVSASALKEFIETGSAGRKDMAKQPERPTKKATTKKKVAK